jgi:tRNA G18 (ribose-2'-O)-methylase SpoU
LKYRRRNIVRMHEIDSIWSRRAELGPYPVILVLDGLKPGFNVGKIIRSANALGCREVFLVGIGPWDPALSRGALKATRTRSFETIAPALEALAAEGYRAYALHPRATLSIGTTSFPEKTAFIVGHEENGFSFDVENTPNVTPIRIPQVGVVESLNVSVAASIAAYDYLRDRGLLGSVGQRAQPIEHHTRLADSVK